MCLKIKPGSRLTLFLFLNILAFIFNMLHCQNTVYVSGIIEGDTTWSADTVKVTGGVSVLGKLTIEPGTYVKFQGYYGLFAYNLNAEGTQSDSIIFTINDTTGFHNPDTTLGGWKGIGADTIIELSYCRVNYVKYVKRIEEYSRYHSSGALHFWSGLITHSKITNNISNGISHSDEASPGGKISDCLIANNKGAGISCECSPCDINSCTIKNNEAGITIFYGYGIYSIDSCQIINNNGYGVDNIRGKTRITNCTISSNSGRGIYMNEPTSALIEGNLISNNSGGISISGHRAPDNGIIINNTIINNSTSSRGGGIFISDHNYPIINNVIAGNSAGSGGGIFEDFYDNTFTLTLINNTIVNNTADHGGGIGIQPNNIPDVEMIFMYNNIIRSNTASIQGDQIYQEDWFGNNLPVPANIYYCNVEDIDSLSITGISENNIDNDPYFVDQLNGNYQLTDSSPCINAGIPDTTGLNLPDFDLAGNPRLSDLIVDIGAYEYYSDSLKVILQPVNEIKCPGDSLTLVTNAAGGVTSYQWQKNGMDIPGAINRYLEFDSLVHNDTGRYNCIINKEYNPISTDTVTVSISIPNVNLGDDITVCAGDVIILDGGDDAENYIWNDGTTGRYKTVDSPGIYWVKAINSAGCIGTDTIAIAYHYVFGEKLAFVSYDNITGKNITAWNKTPDVGTTEYIIYKLYENNYMALDTISYDSGKNYFIDELANPSEYSHIYCLTTKDTCDNESDFDKPHKMLYLSGYIDLVKGMTLLIEKYEGINYDKYYIFKGDDNHNLYLTDSTDCEGFYTTYSNSDYPYSETYYQVGIKLPEKHVFEEIEREFEYSLSNLYFKPRNNTAPYDIILSNNQIDENLPAGSKVGIISALDHDSADHHSFFLVSGQGDTNNIYFQIINDQLISAVSFDYENSAENSIRIRAVDDGPGSLFREELFKIYVNDLAETGFSDKLVINKIIIKPNPVEDYAVIEFVNDTKEEYIMYVRDITGSVVRIKDNITSDKFIFKRGELASGVYLIELSNSERSFTTKVFLK